MRGRRIGILGNYIAKHGFRVSIQPALSPSQRGNRNQQGDTTCVTNYSPRPARAIQDRGRPSRNKGDNSSARQVLQMIGPEDGGMMRWAETRHVERLVKKTEHWE